MLGVSINDLQNIVMTVVQRFLEVVRCDLEIRRVIIDARRGCRESITLV